MSEENTEITTQKQNIDTAQQNTSLAETMGKSLSTKDNALAAAVSGGSKKSSKNKKEDPNQISIGLDKYESKLTNKRV